LTGGLILGVTKIPFAGQARLPAGYGIFPSSLRTTLSFVGQQSQLVD